jgi:sugar (glycoside-pentoside-hexuronide) transporter
LSQPDTGKGVGAGRGPRAVTDVRLSVPRKALYALGDLSSNTVLGTLTLVFATYFLIHVAELRPVLAGLIPLIGRFVDAVTDPLMGRISDLTTWRAGRRRPYLLIGIVPLGASFALLWAVPPVAGEFARFLYYAAVYCSLTVSLTVLSVPYLALQPEMALDYDDRTSLNTFRNAGSVLGIIGALGLRPLAEYYGGDAPGFAAAGSILALGVSLPWFIVFAATFERPGFGSRGESVGFVEGLKSCAARRSFRQLTALYLAGRIAIDLVGAMLVLYFTIWIGRSEDFEIMMAAFMLAVLVSLPLWLNVAAHMDKSRLFIIGALWWAAGSGLLLMAQPDWPRWSMFIIGPVIAVGFAVVDLMPWSMLGEVVDEDELETGERREGVYNGVFTFLRKLAGAAGVFVALAILDFLGMEPDGQQNESVVLAVRLLSSVGPAACLLVAVAFARGYPLTRVRHEEIVRELDARGLPRF